MEETKINFETAKLAKEKGFFDKTFSGEVRLSQPYFYDDEGKLYSIKEAFYDKVFNLKDCCNAPTQSLLQKWLREIHEIDISVVFNYDLRCYNCEIVKWIDGVCNINNSYGFDKFEESIEFGLQEALKLINN